MKNQSINLPINLTSPFDVRAVWNMATNFERDTAICNFACSVFPYSIFPTENGDKNGHFNNAAASILIALIRQLYDQEKGNWGLDEFNKFVSQPHMKLLQCMKNFNPTRAKVIEDPASPATLFVLATFKNGLKSGGTAWLTGLAGTGMTFSFCNAGGHKKNKKLKH